MSRLYGISDIAKNQDAELIIESFRCGFAVDEVIYWAEMCEAFTIVAAVGRSLSGKSKTLA